jgi:predicted O-methyltransferase YrrM
MTVFNPWGNRPEWAEEIAPEIFPPDAEVLTSLVEDVKRPGMMVLEVGSWVGNGSTRVIVETIRKVGGTLYCVDTWTGNDNVKHHKEFRRRYQNLFPIFTENVRKYHGEQFVKPLAMSSLDASNLFADEQFDLVFIDGSHGYSHVKEDVRAWLPKVKFGGILCGHDCEAKYTDLDFRVQLDMKRHLEQDVYHNVAFPGPPAFHAGVIKAVHELFGRKAKLWALSTQSTIWSYRKTRGLIGHLGHWLAKQGLFRTSGPVDQRPLPAPTPWPIRPAVRQELVESSTIHEGATLATLVPHP